jgi:hypothetical protein
VALIHALIGEGTNKKLAETNWKLSDQSLSIVCEAQRPVGTKMFAREGIAVQEETLELWEGAES